MSRYRRALVLAAMLAAAAPVGAQAPAPAGRVPEPRETPICRVVDEHCEAPFGPDRQLRIPLSMLGYPVVRVDHRTPDTPLYEATSIRTWWHELVDGATDRHGLIRISIHSYPLRDPEQGLQRAFRIGRYDPAVAAAVEEARATDGRVGFAGGVVSTYQRAWVAQFRNHRVAWFRICSEPNQNSPGVCNVLLSPHDGVSVAYSHMRSIEAETPEITRHVIALVNRLIVAGPKIEE